MSKYQLVTLGNHIDILSGFAFPSSGFNRKNGVPLTVSYTHLTLPTKLEV